MNGVGEDHQSRGFNKEVDKFAKTEKGMEAGFVGVGVAGAAYGFLSVVYGYFSYSYQGDPFEFVLFSMSMAAFFGFLIAMISGLLAGIILFLLSRSFDVGFDPRIATCVLGGLAGFLPCLPSTFSIVLNFNEPGSITDFVTFIKFVFITMLFGQIGAVFFAWKFTGMKRGAEPIDRRQFQFEIRHLLVATIWIGVLLVVDRLSSNHSFILMCLVYLVLQAMLVLMDQLLVRFGKTKS